MGPTAIKRIAVLKRTLVQFPDVTDPALSRQNHARAPVTTAFLIAEGVGYKFFSGQCGSSFIAACHANCANMQLAGHADGHRLQLLI